MNGLAFQRPDAAWLLAGVAGVLLLVWLVRRRPYTSVAASRLLTGLPRASPLRRFPVVLALLAIVATVGGLMEPVLPFADERIASRGLDIAVVLDLSSSMEEIMGGDVPGQTNKSTRLEVTKAAIADFIRRRPGDRVGLVVFSDNAYVVSPLTLDHAYLQRYVAMIDNQILRTEGMTAIGEGLAVADMLLRRQASTDQHRNRVIVVFTDGEHNHGRDPLDALADAHDAGQRVHLVGVDLDEEVKEKPAVLRLVRAVQARGGRYFVADTDRQLGAASRAIDALETGVLVSNRTVRNVPAYETFAIAAMLALVATLLLRAIPFFVDLT